MNRSDSKYFHTAARIDEAFLALLEKKEFEYITVKEICEKAGVNRSTFYLHYETIADLVAECVDYMSRKCYDHLREREVRFAEDIASAELEKLVLISPQYLAPYLEFMRDNRRMFQVAMRHKALLNTEATFGRMFRRVISPIMDRFQCPADEKGYIIAFYVQGLIAIISEWLKNDCRESIDKIVQICMNCVFSRKTPQEIIRL